MFGSQQLLHAKVYLITKPIKSLLMKLTMFFISCTVSIGGTQMFDKFAFGFFESAFYIALIAGGAACALATGADLLKEN